MISQVIIDCQCMILVKKGLLYCKLCLYEQLPVVFSMKAVYMYPSFKKRNFL
ncbi:unnamed protein product, partial [Schistosoma intercalatum]